jgi:hypothetical protein
MDKTRLLLIALILAFLFTPRFADAIPQIHDPITLDHSYRYHDWQDNSLGLDMLVSDGQIFFAFAQMHAGYPQRGIRTTLLGLEIDPSTFYMQPCET